MVVLEEFHSRFVLTIIVFTWKLLIFWRKNKPCAIFQLDEGRKVINLKRSLFGIMNDNGHDGCVSL